MNGDLHHLTAAYVLDALDEPERAAFEAHYPACDVCRREVDEYRAAAAALATATAVSPPPGLRARVLDEIDRTRQASPADRVPGERRPWFGTPVLAAAAALVVLVVGMVAVAGLRGGSTVEDVLAARDAVVTTLEPAPEGPSGSFQVVWSAERGQVAVIANGLPDPGPGSVYELWAIEGETPVPAGLFDPDGGSLRDTNDVDVDPAAWGVTVEPASGSAAPTTPILFFAET